MGSGTRSNERFNPRSAETEKQRNRKQKGSEFSVVPHRARIRIPDDLIIERQSGEFSEEISFYASLHREPRKVRKLSTNFSTLPTLEGSWPIHVALPRPLSLTPLIQTAVIQSYLMTELFVMTIFPVPQKIRIHFSGTR